VTTPQVDPLLTPDADGGRAGRRTNLATVIGGAVAALVVATALLSFVWTPYDPTGIDPTARLAGPGTGGHLLGTDSFGADVLSQLMAGARVTLLVGVVAVAIAGLIGTPLGILAGMRRGILSDVIVRAGTILFGFPALLLALLLAASFGASTTTAMVAIGVATIPAFLRLAYAATLQVMSTDYVTAARTSGLGGMRIARRHVLPNIASVLLVQASVAFALAILAEAGLSYLGLSTRPPTPSWGRMLHDAQTHLFTDPALSVWPGLAIAAAVLAFNLLGDGLRDLLDPKLRER
jgi:peptide/nickel transport system permease protein